VPHHPVQLQNLLDVIDETVYEHELQNGLRLFVIPKPGFQKTFVTYTTQFGSLSREPN
jgi:hypothetical protein